MAVLARRVGIELCTLRHVMSANTDCVLAACGHVTVWKRCAQRPAASGPILTISSHIATWTHSQPDPDRLLGTKQKRTALDHTENTCCCGPICPSKLIHDTTCFISPSTSLLFVLLRLCSRVNPRPVSAACTAKRDRCHSDPSRRRLSA